MTGDQIQRVRSCGAGLGQGTVPFVDDCFERFFERCPSGRNSFPSDLSGVHEAFARDLGFVVMNAATLSRQRDELHRRGLWYRRRGIDGDVAVDLREAFLDTLESLGGQWSGTVREDWGEVLDCWFEAAFGRAMHVGLSRAA